MLYFVSLKNSNIFFKSLHSQKTSGNTWFWRKQILEMFWLYTYNDRKHLVLDLFILFSLAWKPFPRLPQPPRSLIRWMAQFLLVILIITPKSSARQMPFESRVLRFIESSLSSSDFANKFIQQESSNLRAPLFKEEPTSPPKPSHITAKIRSVAAVKTEPCDRTERK